MNVPIKSKNDVAIPPSGYVFAFIDSNDMQLKAKLSDGLVVNYSNVDSELKTLSLADYSAFEVMPTKVVIPAGTVDEKTGLKYNSDVPSCTVHEFSIRTSHTPEICDVVIDWGDGTYEIINDGKHQYNNRYDLSHDYSKAMKKDIEKFIVKIYGKNYWSFRTTPYNGKNLTCRIFDKDLPIASHLANISATCYGSDRLLKVHFYNFYHRILNFNSCFNKSINLVSVTGVGNILNEDNGVAEALFEGCSALEETDFYFLPGISRLSTTFNGCVKLAKDINDFLPENGFENKNITIGGTFGNCKLLTGTGFGKVFWEDDTVNWTVKPSGGMAGPFSGSSLSSQTPKSWGGTNTEIVPEKYIVSKVSELESTVQELSKKIESIEASLENTLALDK